MGFGFWWIPQEKSYQDVHVFQQDFAWDNWFNPHILDIVDTKTT